MNDDLLTFEERETFRKLRTILKRDMSYKRIWWRAYFWGAAAGAFWAVVGFIIGRIYGM